MSMKAIQASVLHPDEILALLKFQFSSNASAQKLQHISSPTEKRCFELLFLTSRSFAAVILELEEELRLPICLFYLILRGLDTIEDDMTIPTERKIKLMEDFHNSIVTKGWTFHENGPNEKDRILLEEFDVVVDEFLKLKPEYRVIISDITQKMAAGFIEFIHRKVETLEDWDLYCHYAAGLVGHGLTRLFAASGLEDSSLASETELANSMGLFLQKVNIIRDFLEDYEDGRCFWPKQVWSKYTHDLGDFTKDEYKEKALECLSELCTNALGHAQDCLKYMSLIKNPSCFKFCAIPQVMAVSTIAQVFNNPEVFKTNVKIRKGLAVKLIMEATTMEGIQEIFINFSNEILHKTIPTHSTFLPVSIWYGQIKSSINAGKFTNGIVPSQKTSPMPNPTFLFIVFIAVLVWFYYT
ncbi:bifunctional farnesyl-diphosphate farnesyltransferase/squalene synthase [Entomophthora muscae]|uniref:Bifunctional farnesyl-diphosphate farnesyltransferase/squalene synthase n=2 Tax=Entomophthora muscae TaxID=34485 RepID=A0ACC2UDR6_9FUNG|nr:bifunctional farnesyl-diphosphate farnesyltransferase/squalene synthase [Entomophthora muscae]